MFLHGTVLWNHPIAVLEDNVDRRINVLCSITAARWGGNTTSFLHLHAYSSYKARHYILFARTTWLVQDLGAPIILPSRKEVRGCLSLPRATSRELVLVEAREPTVVGPRLQETCRHFFRLVT